MQPTNLLFICSDEHQRAVTGCYGNPLVQTPNLDRLAARGARFDHAYTNCPICVPCRASLATGRYVHQIRYWDNAFPYDGRVRGWGHRLQEQGYLVDSIGKLHYRRQEDDDGFTHKIDAMYVAEGVGELISCIREDPPFRKGRGGILNAGPGESSYLRYDARIADQAVEWLAGHAHDQQPWVLFVSFVNPHPPFIAPPDLYALYPPDQMPLPPQWHPNEWPEHLALDYLRRYFGWEAGFSVAELRNAIATYYAMTTYVDQKIGQVLAALEHHGLVDNTRVLYTTDHGAMVGAHGLWGKFTMYEQSAAVPLILAGPDVPAGKVVKTPVSLVDCHPTILAAVGAQPAAEDADLPGQSLWSIAQEADWERTVFSEYHAAGSRHGVYMVTDGHTKYIHYLTEPPQLFDLDHDPQELRNLAAEPGNQDLVAVWEARLRTFVDPEATDALAKADQQQKLADFGGAEAVLRRGLSNSAIPGEKPVFQQVGRG
ncbi:MAG: sulfatase [Chloroflexi bacterium]|nr:MAG: sulfatase [Chloroflexota bacterium]